MLELDNILINSYILQEFSPFSSHHPRVLVILDDMKVEVMLYGGIFWKSSINFKLKFVMPELCISLFVVLCISHRVLFFF